MSNHPASCKSPLTCTLTYRQHLLGFGVSATLIPNRAVHRSPNAPDEPAINTLTREKRWERDHEAFRRLHKQGYQPPQIEGSRFRERAAENPFDIECRQVTIDYKDPS